jgi:hypothetical protein
LEELQARVAELERENSTLKSTSRSASKLTSVQLDNVEFLTTFTYPSFEKPITPWPMDFTSGSLASQDPSFAQISLTYDYDKFISERISIPIPSLTIVLNPLTVQNTLDEQTFVRTLNTLCLTHAMQILILDPPNSDNVQQKFGNPLKVSSPAVIASRIAARLVHMVLDDKVRSAETVPWVDTDIAPWRLSDDMLELTPRDVWGFLKSHPNFNDVDIRAFYQSVVDKSYCSGFGPVITTSDVKNALVRVHFLSENELISVVETVVEFSNLKKYVAMILEFLGIVIVHFRSLGFLITDIKKYYLLRHHHYFVALLPHHPVLHHSIF